MKQSQISKSGLTFSKGRKEVLGDNFSFGEVPRLIYDGKFSFTVTQDSCKMIFPTVYMMI